MNQELIKTLMDKYRMNTGQTTEAEKQRQAAVNYLTGKVEKKPLRPEVRKLSGKD